MSRKPPGVNGYRGASLDVRVVLVRRRRTKRMCAVVTNVAETVLSATEGAGAYFDRWRRQELRFRTFGSAHFKRVSGYGKRLVTNVAVVTDLEKLKLQKARLVKRIE